MEHLQTLIFGVGYLDSDFSYDCMSMLLVHSLVRGEWMGLLTFLFSLVCVNFSIGPKM